MEQRQFRVGVCYDKQTLRELNFGTLYLARGPLVIQISVAVALLCYAALLWMGSDSWYVWAIPLWLVLMLVLTLVGLSGNKQYKRILVDNGGQLLQYELVFNEEAIAAYKGDSGAERVYPYEQIRKIGETRNLLVLVMEQDLCLVVDKRRLEGCTKEELVSFLFERCKKLKKKKVVGSEQLIPRCIVFGVLLIAALSGGVYQWLFGDDYEGSYEPDYYWAGYLTVDELTARLEKLGFDPVDEAVCAYLEGQWSEYTYDELAYVNKVSALLWEIGCGEYRENTTVWEPSSADVYALDEEYWYAETMYEEFFSGVGALKGIPSDFAIVSEDTDGVNWEDGTGIWEITFLYDGEEHTLTAEVYGSWIDPCFVNDMNEIIGENSDKRLYFGYDDDWVTYYVFYCDDQWAKEFYEATGMWLYDEMYEYEDSELFLDDAIILNAVIP